MKKKVNKKLKSKYFDNSVNPNYYVKYKSCCDKWQKTLEYEQI